MATLFMTAMVADMDGTFTRISLGYNDTKLKNEALSL